MPPRSALKIRLLTLEEIHTVYHVYMIDDFGEMELKPFGRIEADFAAGKYEGYGLFEGKMIISYALFVITDTGVALLDYLGVREDLRDQGYGTKTLQMLEPELTKYDMMIVEVENPFFAEGEEDRTEKERRIAFYTKNGFVPTGVDVQLFTVEYSILEFVGTTRKPHDPDSVRAAYRELYKRMVGDALYSKFVIIR